MIGDRAARALGLVACASVTVAPQEPSRPMLRPQTSGVSVVLQAVSAPSERVAWVSGHGGVVLRTTDGGATWDRLVVPHAESLQFRDLHARDAEVAWLLAAGPGERSRIYATTDGGHQWALQFLNRDSSAFYDCFAFWDADRAVAFSDAVRGGLVVLMTDNGGAQWRRVADAALPPAQPGEGAFAASGACVISVGDRHAWIGTGAASTARVLRTTDGGGTWTAVPVPIPGGPAAGIAALAFRDTLRGVALGGNIADPGDSTSITVARTADGGRTWQAAGRTALRGATYGAAFAPGTPLLLAVGPGGLDWSPDGGGTWTTLDTAPYWSVGFASRHRGWAVGPAGRIVRVDVP